MMFKNQYKGILKKTIHLVDRGRALTIKLKHMRLLSSKEVYYLLSNLDFIVSMCYFIVYYKLRFHRAHH